MRLFKFFGKKLLDRSSYYIFRQLEKIKLEKREYRNSQIKKMMKSCGKGVEFWGDVKISGLDNIYFGNNVHIGDNAFIRGEGGLTIGDNTIISRNLVLYTINHNYRGSRLPFDEDMIHKSVSIGNNVWIGMNVCITPGTIIHDGSIIGMGAVVSGEVPPLAIIGNEKWRILGFRNKAHYDKLVKNESFGGANGVEYNADFD